jgi:hypothetical protein
LVRNFGISVASALAVFQSPIPKMWATATPVVVRTAAPVADQEESRSQMTGTLAVEAIWISPNALLLELLGDLSKWQELSG